MPPNTQTPLLSSFPSIPHHQPAWSYPILCLIWATQALATSFLVYFLAFYILVPGLRQHSHQHVHILSFVFITALVLLALSLLVLYTISWEIALYRSPTRGLTARTYARLQLLKLIYLVLFYFLMWHGTQRQWYGRAFVRMAARNGGWVGCLPFVGGTYYSYVVAKREDVAFYGHGAVVDRRWFTRASE